MTSRAPKVIVIGGGIGGLCLSQGLRRAGVAVRVYERDRTSSARVDRYRLHINPAGSRALRACLPEEAWRRYLAGAGRPGGGFGFLDPQLRTQVVVEDEIMYPATEDPGERAYPVDRSMLRRALLTGLGEVVVFDRCFERYETLPDGRVRAHFSGGGHDEGDVLVGADGAHSTVLRQYLPGAAPIDTGAFGVGLRLPLTAETRRWLPPRLGVGENQIMDRRPFFLFTSVYEPCDPGPPGYLLCAFVARRDACRAGMSELAGGRLRDAVSATIADWHPDLRRVIAGCDPDSAASFAFTVSAEHPGWPPSPVTLLGDAVHAMPPTGGLGANTALRDAHLLTRRLAAAAAGEICVVEAIGRYEAQMREHARAATEVSVRMLRDGLGGNPFGPAWFRVCHRVPRLRRATFGEVWAGPARARDWERRTGEEPR